VTRRIYPARRGMARPRARLPTEAIERMPGRKGVRNDVWRAPTDARARLLQPA
jgi:hypothetical protein